MTDQPKPPRNKHPLTKREKDERLARERLIRLSQDTACWGSLGPGKRRRLK